MPSIDLDQRLKRLTVISDDYYQFLKSKRINGEDDLIFVEFQDLLATISVVKQSKIDIIIN